MKNKRNYGEGQEGNFNYNQNLERQEKGQQLLIFSIFVQTIIIIIIIYFDSLITSFQYLFIQMSCNNIQ